MINFFPIYDYTFFKKTWKSCNLCNIFIESIRCIIFPTIFNGLHITTVRNDNIRKVLFIAPYYVTFNKKGLVLLHQMVLVSYSLPCSILLRKIKLTLTAQKYLWHFVSNWPLDQKTKTCFFLWPFVCFHKVFKTRKSVCVQWLHVWMYR